MIWAICGACMAAGPLLAVWKEQGGLSPEDTERWMAGQPFSEWIKWAVAVRMGFALFLFGMMQIFVVH